MLAYVGSALQSYLSHNYLYFNALKIELVFLIQTIDFYLAQDHTF